MDREIIKGFLDIILLSLLKNEDMYGYKISKKIQDLSQGKISIGEGTLYPALKRLNEKQYIESYWLEIPGKSIKRKYYKITSDGESILNKKIDDYEIIKSLITLCIEKGGEFSERDK